MTTHDNDVWNEFFADESPASPAVALRGVRLKVQPGGLTVAHPEARGPRIIMVQQVPATIPDSEVLTRMGKVTILRRGRADYDGSQVVAWGEIAGDVTGLILR